MHRLLPDDREVTGLLALMLLTDARAPARIGPHGELVPMAEQDRSRWQADQIAEGVELITGALPRGVVGPYQLQAAIAAVHDEAPSAAATDWPQITALYEVLLGMSDNPVVALNHAVAVAMAAVRRPAWRCSPTWPTIPDWPTTHGCRPPAPTCGSWSVSGSRRGRRTGWRRPGRRTWRSSAT